MYKARIIESVKRLDLAETTKLMNGDASLLTVTDRTGRNLLHLACSAPCSTLNVPEDMAVPLVDFLLDCGMDIESPVGKDACTPLFFAVARGRNPTLVNFLIERGAKPKSAPGGGLFAAGWWEDIENLESLIRAGAYIDVVVGMTPFLACWCWRRFEAAKFLAIKGADVNYQDAKGKTALHHGVEKEFDPALLKWLVDHGASPDIEDSAGVSARLKASRKRDKRFVAAFAGSS